MEQTNIKEVLKSSDYDFLRNNRYLGDNIILLALGGSRAYGTDLPTSDIDVRGIAINPSRQIFGLESDFEHVVETNTDTTIYSLNKMVELLIKCNPNTIEILGCRPEDYLYVTPYGKMILDNTKNFLSIRALDTFGGYAREQYNRLEHALLGNGENDKKELNMLLHSLQCAIEAFNIKHRQSKSNLELRILSDDEYKEVIKEKYEQEKEELKFKLASAIERTIQDKDMVMQDKVNKVQSITDLHKNSLKRADEKYLDKLDNIGSDIGEMIVASGDFNKYPVGDIQSLLRELHKIKSTYGSINKRNNKKDSFHMAKHMMHLLRAYKMGTKLNTDMEIHTHWDGKDRDMLMRVRLGEFMTGDGMKVKPEFYDLLKEVQDEYDYSVKHTILPNEPNYEAINTMLQTIYMDKYKI